MNLDEIERILRRRAPDEPRYSPRPLPRPDTRGGIEPGVLRRATTSSRRRVGWPGLVAAGAVAAGAVAVGALLLVGSALHLRPDLTIGGAGLASSGGVGSTVAGSGESTAAAPGTWGTASPGVSIGPAQVVPWTDATPTPEPPSPTPIPVPSGTPACAADQVDGSAIWQGATGNMVGPLTVTNVGTVPCRLEGPPALVQILSSGQGILPIDYVAHGSSDAGLTAPAGPVLLRPGDRAAAFLAWSEWCGAPVSGHLELLVTLSSAAGHVTAPVAYALVPRCDTPGLRSTLAGFAFVAVPPQPAPAPEPVTASTTLLLPPTAVIGQTLHFQVRLTNTGGHAASLDPCPAYGEHLVVGGAALKVESSYLLNCAAIGQQIDPGQTVVLDMAYDVPAGLAPGPAQLVWDLEPGGPFDALSGLARAPITLVAP